MNSTLGPQRTTEHSEAMKKRTFTRRFKILSVLAFTLVFFGTLCAQITKEELSRTIDIGKLQHPYLYFSEADKPTILKRIQIDPECRDIMAGLLAEGHRLLYVPVKNPPPPRLEHPRYSAAPDEANAYASEISEGAVKLASSIK